MNSILSDVYQSAKMKEKKNIKVNYLFFIEAIIVEAGTKMLEQKCRTIKGYPRNQIVAINDPLIIDFINSSSPTLGCPNVETPRNLSNNKSSLVG